MAKPLLDIKEAHVISLASKLWSGREIASHLGCCESTLRRRFAAAIKQGRDKGTSRLRDRQMEAALDGQPTMLVWLGKQYLGQSDKLDTTAKVTREASSLDMAELERYRLAMSQADVPALPMTKGVSQNVTIDVEALPSADPASPGLSSN
tara:strand:- start:6423 stop:6872 length:450 start_codon:yes stop_codon:yes gene_type:complete